MLALGREASLDLSGATTLDGVWAEIDRFIDKHRAGHLVGFIGFDPANQMGQQLTDYRQKVDLFVPSTVIRCAPDKHTVLKGQFQGQVPGGSDTGPGSRELDARDLDQPPARENYRAAVSGVLEAIHSGEVERITLARRVETHRTLDLLGSFLSDKSRHACARNFYFGNESIQFAGQSPELLAEGNPDSFVTHKLSGTWHRNPALEPGQQVQGFLSDERITAEHLSATNTIEDSLRQLGPVDCQRFRAMELPTLLHGWSQFTTRPDPACSVASCLRAVFPFGVKPMDSGLTLLRRLEPFLRGPYYGLVGYVRPDNSFSFTQVLRAAFKDRQSSYLMVGAAVTAHSTPELEVEETCTKLSGIQVCEAAERSPG